MKVTLIAAVAENRVIGRGGTLPWHLPDDLRRFKQRTDGHTVIMGRRTFESLDGPLPNRPAIVISRNRELDVGAAMQAGSLDEAIEIARDRGEREVFILGGAEIYALALPLADRLELTVVHAEVDGDTYFPDFDLADWTITQDRRHEADDRHAYPFSFRRYDRAIARHSS